MRICVAVLTVNSVTAADSSMISSDVMVVVVNVVVVSVMVVVVVVVLVVRRGPPACGLAGGRQGPGHRPHLRLRGDYDHWH